MSTEFHRFPSVRNKNSFFFSAIFFSPAKAMQPLPLMDMDMVDIFMLRTFLAQFVLF